MGISELPSGYSIKPGYASFLETIRAALNTQGARAPDPQISPQASELAGSGCDKAGPRASVATATKINRLGFAKDLWTCVDLMPYSAHPWPEVSGHPR